MGASAQAQATQNAISLRGSTQIVTEFFGYAVNSILYQRGIYPPESFDRQKKYGLAMMVTSDEGLTKYLTSVLKQMSAWLLAGQLQKMVLVVSSAASKDVLERWTFDVLTDREAAAGQKAVEKPESEIVAEVQAIIRQITASVTFLPLLDESCTFDLLLYTDKSSEVSAEWEDSDPRYITHAEDVKLRAFTTKMHKVDTLVSYRTEAASDA